MPFVDLRTSCAQSSYSLLQGSFLTQELQNRINYLATLLSVFLFLKQKQLLCAKDLLFAHIEEQKRCSKLKFDTRN